MKISASSLLWVSPIFQEQTKSIIVGLKHLFAIPDCALLCVFADGTLNLRTESDIGCRISPAVVRFSAFQGLQFLNNRSGKVLILLPPLTDFLNSNTKRESVFFTTAIQSAKNLVNDGFIKRESSERKMQHFAMKYLGLIFMYAI